MRKPLFWNDKVKLNNGKISNLLDGDLHGVKVATINIPPTAVNNPWGNGMFITNRVIDFDFSNKTILTYSFYPEGGATGLYALTLSSSSGTLAIARGTAETVEGKLVILYKED